MSTTTGGRLSHEAAAVWCKRYGEALDAGMRESAADRFASSSVDIGELRRLVGLECPPALLALFLLDE